MAWVVCAGFMGLLPVAGAAPLPGGVLDTLKPGFGGTGKLDEALHNAVQVQLEAAKAANKEADALAQELDRLRARARVATPALPVPLSDEEQNSLFRQWKQRIAANAGMEVLERLLSEEQESMAALRSGIEKSAAEQANLLSQTNVGRADLSKLQQRVQESAEPVTEEPGEADALVQARQARRSAEHRRAALELALRQEEPFTLEARQRVLAVQLQAQRNELLERVPRVAWLTQRITEHARQQLELQARDMAQVAEQAATASPSIRELALTNSELAGEILKHTNHLTRERRTLADDEYIRDQLIATLRETKARLRLGGGSAEVGKWLWKRRVELSSAHAMQAQLKSVQRSLGELRLAMFNSSRSRFILGTAESAAVEADAQAQAQVPSPARQQEGEESLQRATLINRHVALTDQLQPVLLRRISVLEQTEEALQAIMRSGSELRQVLDKEMLWFPSHRPMDSLWLDEWRSLRHAGEDSSGGDLHAASASPWKTARVLASSIWTTPWPYGGIAAIVALLLVLRRYARRQLQAIALRVGNFSQDHFGLSLMALGWSLLYTLPWTVGVIALGEMMQYSPTHGEALEPLGRALKLLSSFIFVATLLNVFFRTDGLALAHFGWPADRVRTLSLLVRRVAWLVVPAELLGGMALYSRDDAAISTWGRLPALMMSLGLVWIAWRYFRHSRKKSRNGFHWGQLVSAVLMPLLTCLAIAIVLGYVYTATEMIRALLASFVFLAASEMVVSMLRRWLLLGERRMTLSRLREAAERIQNEASPETGTHTPDEATQMALVTVGKQAHRLLGLLQRVLIVLSLASAWLPLLPALLRTEGVVLWYTTNTGADGLAQSAPVTLMDVLLGTLVLLLTVSFARNLPGLLELTLSASTRISSSARYTMATLARYAITIAGTVTAFMLLGLRWSQLQWMVAALTVGLGFGLQEIFANFVSGLILLVERPFRVGDVITIDSLTGTVTRIRTRATTVLDFDNKEMVIPNKTFITGQVTNWTLSDEVTRLVIPVAVAHDSNPAQVRDMLLGIANEHPKVLREPEPNCWFMALEGNGQKFELRAYVATVADRLPTLNDLNRRIHDRLGEAGIHIAFPQLDLHVRDVPENTPPLPPSPVLHKG